MEIEKDSAQVKTPPPILFLAAILAGVALRYAVPLPLGLGRIGWMLGLPLAGSAFAVIVYCNLHFKKVGTNIAPWKATTTLMTSDIYGLSRNPIYLSFTLLCAGIGLAADNAWLLLTAGLFAVAVRFLVIAKEEAYLESKFGEEYRRYRASVRRWL